MVVYLRVCVCVRLCLVLFVKPKAIKTAVLSGSPHDTVRSGLRNHIELTSKECACRVP